MSLRNFCIGWLLGNTALLALYAIASALDAVALVFGLLFVLCLIGMCAVVVWSLWVLADTDP